MVVSLNRAEKSFLRAVNFSDEPNPHKGKKGNLKEVHKWGHSWVIPRERFGNALAKSITGSIHTLATALFHTLWSLTAGKLFVDSEPREMAGRRWEDLGKNLLAIAKSISGIIAPAFAKWLNDHLMKIKL